MSATTASPARSGRSLWVLLGLASLVMTLAMGLRQSMGLFHTPLATLGISASTFGFALALQNIVWGASQPFVGALADRYGARPVLIGTALIYAAGLVVMGVSGGAVGLGLGAGLMVGVGVAGTGFGVLLGVVSRAVPEHRRSQTVGAVAATGSFGTALLAPVAQGLIGASGWRVAILVFAGVALVMAALCLGIAERRAAAPTSGSMPAEPAAADEPLGRVLRDALTHPGFLGMTAAFFACGFQLVFITAHLPAFLAICGIPASVSATALGVIGLTNAIGTYVVGLLGARFSQPKLLALTYLLRTVAICAYLALPITGPSTLVFAAVLGLLWLGVTPLVSGIIGRLFGLRHFSTLFGIVFFSHQVGSFCGALLGGLSFDLTGSYTIAWASLIAIGLVAFLLQWPMDDRPSALRRLPAVS